MEENNKEIETTEEVKKEETTTEPVEEKSTEPVVEKTKKDNTKIKKIIKLVVILLVVIAVIVGVVIGGIKIYQHATKDAKKVESLVDIKSKKGKFMIGDDELKLGGTYKELKEKGYVFDSRYISNDDAIGYDMIYVQSVLKDNKEQFLGMFYCGNKEGCKYEDTILIKATFYSNTNYLLNDVIKNNTSYDAIKEKIGKEKGYFKEDKTYLVWTFGEAGKIGETYYMIKFDNGYSKTIKELRIGVWWYEEEYKHTVTRRSDS